VAHTYRLAAHTDGYRLGARLEMVAHSLGLG